MHVSRKNRDAHVYTDWSHQMWLTLKICSKKEIIFFVLDLFLNWKRSRSGKGLHIFCYNWLGWETYNFRVLSPSTLSLTAIGNQLPSLLFWYLIRVRSSSKLKWNLLMSLTINTPHVVNHGISMHKCIKDIHLTTKIYCR